MVSLRDPYKPAGEPWIWELSRDGVGTVTAGEVSAIGAELDFDGVVPGGLSPRLGLLRRHPRRPISNGHLFLDRIVGRPRV